MNREEDNKIKPIEKLGGFKPFKPVEPCRCIDLRKTECPINFVKAKLELEKIQSGEILQIWLCGDESITNVPESLKAEGHKIVSQNKENDYYILKVQKA